MLIDQLNIIDVTKVENGFNVEVELEAEDGFSFGGSIFFDSKWNYDLGFLATFINTKDDKDFINEVLSSHDFRNDVLTFPKIV